jgi:hypothetical protein
MKAKLILAAAVCALMTLTGPGANAATVWSEDFSDVSDWAVVFDPSSGSTITSDGNLGLLFVNGGSTLAAFAPSSQAPFDPINKADYTLDFNVNNVTWSTSYDIALDEFDSGGNYLSTVWQVFPTEFSSTATGPQSINLGGFTFNAATANIAPKINVYTGDAGQTVSFDSMSLDLAQVPEVSSWLMLSVGLVGIAGLMRSKFRK